MKARYLILLAGTLLLGGCFYPTPEPDPYHPHHYAWEIDKQLQPPNSAAAWKEQSDGTFRHIITEGQEYWLNPQLGLWQRLLGYGPKYIIPGEQGTPR